MEMLVSWRDIELARETIKGCGVVVRTPLLRNVEQMFGFEDRFKLSNSIASVTSAAKSPTYRDATG